MVVVGKKNQTHSCLLCLAGNPTLLNIFFVAPLPTSTKYYGGGLPLLRGGALVGYGSDLPVAQRRAGRPSAAGRVLGQGQRQWLGERRRMGQNKTTRGPHGLVFGVFTRV